MTCPSCTNTRSACRHRSRRAAAALCLLLAAPSLDRASAADWPDVSFLRGSVGPSSYVRWDGLNAGAQVGLSNLNTDFGNSTSSLVAFILRNSTLENEASPSTWTTLPSNTTNSKQYGAFIGYNVQWDQLVVGGDLAYNHPSSLVSSASDTITRLVTTSDGVHHTVTIDATSSLKLVDYATFRARAGYAFGQFLPYAVIGAAVGRFNYATSATVTDPQTNPVNNFGPITDTDAKDNAVVAGFVGGLGMDVALMPNVFLRGEWEYIAFAPVNGIRSNTNTGRVGVGVRF
jgi:outer membrane immunogenic protein